jgi:nitrate reductase NapAB chaperone NapD
MIASVVALIDRQQIDSIRLNDAVESRAGFEVGEACGPKVPLTIEAVDGRELEAATEWLRSLPGVLHVDVIYVNFDEGSA